MKQLKLSLFVRTVITFQYPSMSLGRSNFTVHAPCAVLFHTPDHGTALLWNPRSCVKPAPCTMFFAVLCRYIILIYHASVSGHLDGFHIFTTVIKVAISTGV